DQDERMRRGGRIGEDRLQAVRGRWELAALDGERGESALAGPPRELAQERALADPPGPEDVDDPARRVVVQAPLQRRQLGGAAHEALLVDPREARGKGPGITPAPRRTMLRPVHVALTVVPGTAAPQIAICDRNETGVVLRGGPDGWRLRVSAG